MSKLMKHIKENRFHGDLIEYGTITALFEDIPESEVGVTSGAQSAFNGARQFIKEMVANQCKLAGCMPEEHAKDCWFAKRAALYTKNSRRANLSEAYWKARYHAAEGAFQKLKTLTKQIPAGTWTDDYRELAGMVHTLGRDVFWVPLCGACGKCEECLKIERGE